MNLRLCLLREEDYQVLNAEGRVISLSRGSNPMTFEYLLDNARVLSEYQVFDRDLRLSKEMALEDFIDRNRPCNCPAMRIYDLTVPRCEAEYYDVDLGLWFYPDLEEPAYVPTPWSDDEVVE